jgi:hypothetical protein
MSRDDLLNGNVDLMSFCARLIEAQPATSLRIQWNAPVLELEAGKLDRIDVYVDGRPHNSHDIADRLELSLDHAKELIRVEGYQGENLQQVRTVRLT